MQVHEAAKARAKVPKGNAPVRTDDAATSPDDDVIKAVQRAYKAVECLAAEKLYRQNWVAQIKIYAQIRELLTLGVEPAQLSIPWEELVGFYLAYAEIAKRMLEVEAEVSGNERDKYVAGLYVLALQLADWADHALQGQGLVDCRICRAGLQRAVGLVGPLEEYCHWLAFLGYPGWADRIERDYERLLHGAAELDECEDEDDGGKEGSDDGDRQAGVEDEAEDETDYMDIDVAEEGFKLSSRIASIALLLGAPEYDTYYHRIYGICPTRPQAAASKHTGETAEDGGTEWREVMARLRRLRDQGEPYTGYRDLAKRMACSPSTLYKVFNASFSLQGWRDRHKKRKAVPRAQGLTDVVADRLPSQREADPSDDVSGDEIDKALAKLRNEANAEERAKLDALDEDERRGLALVYLDQEADRHIQENAKSNRILGRKP